MFQTQLFVSKQRIAHCLAVIEYKNVHLDLSDEQKQSKNITGRFHGLMGIAYIFCNSTINKRRWWIKLVIRIYFALLMLRCTWQKHWNFKSSKIIFYPFFFRLCAEHSTFFSFNQKKRKRKEINDIWKNKYIVRNSCVWIWAENFSPISSISLKPTRLSKE